MKTMPITITFPFRPDEPTVNGNIYPKSEVISAIAEFNKKSQLHKMVYLVQKSEPTAQLNPNPTDVVGCVRNVYIYGATGSICADIDIMLNSPAIKTIQNAVEFGGFLKANPLMQGMRDNETSRISDLHFIRINVFVSFDLLGELYTHTVTALEL